MYVTFDARMIMKSEDLKVKNSQTMLKKIEFEMEILVGDTRDEEEVKTPTSSSSEKKSTMVRDYHLIKDNARRKIVPP